MKIIPNKLQVNVRLYAGAYCVTRMSKSASSTMSAAEAVLLLARKIWGPGLHTATPKDAASRVWEIERSNHATQP